MYEQDMHKGDGREAGGKVGSVLTVLYGVVGLVDLALEVLVAAAASIRRNRAGPQCRHRRNERPLLVVGAMTMVSDHVLRDVGLDRATIAAITELSVDDIDGCRLDRAAA